MSEYPSHRDEYDAIPSIEEAIISKSPSEISSKSKNKFKPAGYGPSARHAPDDKKRNDATEEAEFEEHLLPLSSGGSNLPASTVNISSADDFSPRRRAGIRHPLSLSLSALSSFASRSVPAPARAGLAHDRPADSPPAAAPASDLVIIAAVVLCGDGARGITFPTLYPLIRRLGGSTVTQGYAVASFSLGRIVAGPYFGSHPARLGYRRTLVTSLSILTVGTVLYALSPATGNIECLLIAQVVMGFGSGTLGVTRAYVADITKKEERTGCIALLTAVQYAGFTMMPFAGIIFEKLLKGKVLMGSGRLFYLDIFTAPAYAMTIACMCTILALVGIFNDRLPPLAPTKSKKLKGSFEDEWYQRPPSRFFPCISIYDTALLGCMILNIATKGSIAVFETIGIRFAAEHFNVKYSIASLVVGFCGTIGVASLVYMGLMKGRASDTVLITGGIGVMIASVGALVLLTMRSSDAGLGWYFLCIFLIYAFGYPVGHTALIGMFSKIIGRRPQGLLLGWFASSGSFARIGFPIVSGYIQQIYGTSTLFLSLGVILTASIFFLMLFRNTLNKLIL